MEAFFLRSFKEVSYTFYTNNQNVSSAQLFSSIYIYIYILHFFIYIYFLRSFKEVSLFMSFMKHDIFFSFMRFGLFHLLYIYTLRRKKKELNRKKREMKMKRLVLEIYLWFGVLGVPIIEYYNYLPIDIRSIHFFLSLSLEPCVYCSHSWLPSFYYIVLSSFFVFEKHKKHLSNRYDFFKKNWK